MGPDKAVDHVQSPQKDKVAIRDETVTGFKVNHGKIPYGWYYCFKFELSLKTWLITTLWNTN